MNWDTALTTLWNKISKPITNLCIGAAFLVAAPEKTAWFGWIFLAIGIGSFLDSQSRHIPRLWNRVHKQKAIKEELQNLSKIEKRLLEIMVTSKKKIMRDSDFKQALSHIIPDASNRLPNDIYNYFQSLEDKELVYYDVNGAEYFSVTVRDDVWKIIKTRYKKDLSPTEMTNKEEA